MHTQREIASLISIFTAQFRNLFATTFLAYKALKGCRRTEKVVLHNSVPMSRKLGKITCLSAIITPVRVQGET